MASSSSPSSPLEFGVFLSFRGEDTRKTFTDHLYEALKQRGVKAFVDEEGLQRGDKIKDRILKAIEGSIICIPILSKSYADSKWCLMELAKMVQCQKTIIPVFYHVDPSDVRHQRGPFDAAFQKHTLHFDEDTVMDWRIALRKVGEISGYNTEEVANGHEAKLIRMIVERVLHELYQIAQQMKVKMAEQMMIMQSAAQLQAHALYGTNPYMWLGAQAMQQQLLRQMQAGNLRSSPQFRVNPYGGLAVQAMQQQQLRQMQGQSQMQMAEKQLRSSSQFGTNPYMGVRSSSHATTTTKANAGAEPNANGREAAQI